MSQENVEIVMSLADALQRGDSAGALSVLDVDVEWHDQAAIPGAEVHRGRDAVSRHFDQWFDAWEEIEYTPEELLDGGDRVVVVIRRRGKGKGSGVEVSDQVIHVYTVRSKKIVRFEGFSDKDEALAVAGLSE
jgi:ketosteroid isomerase-like protein